MIKDRHVFWTCALAAVWLIGVEMGEANPKNVVASCPPIAQGEKLISITIDRSITRCTYQPAATGRITRTTKTV